MLEGPYFVGDTVTLADLFVYPILDYFRHTPEGQEFLGSAPKLLRWLDVMDQRQSSQILLAA